ncbi:MAG: ATP-binding cassette domain-containing protein [Leptolyngbya sp. PLA3]|nr:MAG: ATP-binding cassette domain-containing protein [Cyanobacteria bacterium CYA]MCE7967928.1 ATP-binding cassette domain-containing protein [Leptolyngbya sp. PL-A3]
MQHAIELDGVRKAFGGNVAVAQMDLAVPTGGVYGFIGPNGAGKSTTIRMIMGILFPDEGTVGVLGRRNAVEARQKVGYLPEERGVYRKMKVGAFLRYVGRLKGMGTGDLERQIRAWLGRVDLGETIHKKCEELSKGMQQKVQFIAAVINRPELLILDEPFSGLDPVNMRLLRDLIREQHSEGRTIIFSTHVMAQAEQVCEHIVMIDRGQKVLDDSLASIRAQHDPRTIVFEPFDPKADLSVLSGVPGVRHVAQPQAGAMREISLREEANAGEVMRLLAGAVVPSRLELRRPSLEDVFIRIVSGKDDLRTPEQEERLRAAVRENGAGREVGA